MTTLIKHSNDIYKVGDGKECPTSKLIIEKNNNTGKIKVYFVYYGSPGDKEVNLLYRFDKNQPISKNLKGSYEYFDRRFEDGQGIIVDNPLSFIDDILKHKNLFIKFIWNRHEVINSFDLSGLSKYKDKL